jgi:hypothetical protein
LDAYQSERLPITEQVSRFAMNHEYALAKERRAVSPQIEQEGEAGEAVREETGRKLFELNVKQYCCAGLNFGYFYDQSPIIAYDEESHPSYTINEFTSTTVPGCRAPHFWLPNGQSFYDILGLEFTLLRLDQTINIKAFQDLASQNHIPIKLIDLNSAWVDSAYRHKLFLIRPDQHIAWRGNDLSIDSNHLLRIITGQSNVNS